MQDWSVLPEELLRKIFYHSIKSEADNAYHKMRLCLSGPSATQEHPIKISVDVHQYATYIDLNADGIPSEKPRPASFPNPFWSVIFHYGNWRGKVLPRYLYINRYIGPGKEGVRSCIGYNIEFRKFAKTICDEWEANAVVWILTALQSKKGVIWNALEKSIVPGDKTAAEIIERMSDVAGYMIKYILDHSEYSIIHSLICNIWKQCGFKLSCSTYDHIRDDILIQHIS